MPKKTTQNDLPFRLITCLRLLMFVYLNSIYNALLGQLMKSICTKGYCRLTFFSFLIPYISLLCVCNLQREKARKGILALILCFFGRESHQ